MRRLLTPGWLACHLLLLAAVVAMLGLAGWQFVRASQGNLLSWGYTLQWPVFAGFAVFIWAREVRRVLRGEPAELALVSQTVPRRVRPDRSAATATPASTGTYGTEAAGATDREPVITRRPSTQAYDDRDDPELAAYNHYLSWLAANPGARPVDYPG